MPLAVPSHLSRQPGKVGVVVRQFLILFFVLIDLPLGASGGRTGGKLGILGGCPLRPGRRGGIVAECFCPEKHRETHGKGAPQGVGPPRSRFRPRPPRVARSPSGRPAAPRRTISA